MSFIQVCLRRLPPTSLKFLGLALGLVGAGAAAQEPTFMVLNPTGYQPPVELKSMAERPETLDGKTIFFVDQTFNNADVILEEMMKWFNMHMPEVKTVYRRKTGGYTTDDPALWREIQAANGLMIMAIGH
jgi:hypothetical protein